MTVSYKKGSDGGYYTRCMSSDEDRSKGVDDYYANQKEPPGVWFVNGRNELFGLKNGGVFDPLDPTTDIEAFHNLVKGYSPDGVDLVGKNRLANRVGFHDFTYSPPKSLSVIWSQAEEPLKAGIEADQTTAARFALAFKTSKALSRQGKGGAIKMPVAATIAALFGHGSSRANDPQLHTHCVLLNLCLRQDGKIGALDGKEMLKWTGASASLYHAHIAWSFVKRGFKIERNGNLFEVAGVPEAVRDYFSERRKQMEEFALKEMVRMGLPADVINVTRGLWQKAAIETRDAKNELTRAQLEKLWLERGVQIGFTADQVKEIMNVAEVKDLTPEQLMVESLEALKEIHENNAVFSEPALVTAVAVRMVGIASPEQILESVQRLKNEVLLSCEEVLENGEIITHYTSREMVALEHRMLELANRKDGRHILKDVQISDKLIGEQREALIAATSDVNAVTVIEGTAGAGKTFTMASIAVQYKANGYDVQGIAVAWKAAKNLKKEASLDAGRAIEGWVNDVRNGKIGLTDKTVVIIDEAGMVGAKHMKNVLELAEAAGSKVILLGDTLQQKAIAAGDALRNIVKQNGSTRLDVIRRQKREEDKVAVKLFFDGKAIEGFKPYTERGDVHILKDADAVHEKLIGDWMASRAEHQDKSHLIIAGDNKSVLALNRLAHEARLAAGELGTKSIMVKTMDCKSELDALIEFHVGETVAIRKNQKNSRARTQEAEDESRVSNRDVAVIEDIRDGLIYARTLVEGKELVIDPESEKWQHRDGGVALQYGYAVTTYSSQGLTEDRVFVKDSSSMNRASAGVAMSRHREYCGVYVDKHARWEQSMRSKTEEEWIPLHQYTEEACMNSVEYTWSRESKKASTLDYQSWQTPEGAILSPQAELEIQRIKDASAIAQRELARIQRESKLPDVPLHHVLPFQQSDAYKVPPSTYSLSEQGLEGSRRLLGEEIEPEAMRQAVRDKFLSFTPEGEALFLSRRQADKNAVVHVADKDGITKASLPLSERFPAILNGDPAEVDIVKTGLDALRLRSIQLREGHNTSTIIVADSNEKLSLTETRDLINKATEVRRFDRQADKSVSSEKVTYEAVSLQEANQESSRQLAQQIERERQREAERNKTL